MAPRASAEAGIDPEALGLYGRTLTRDPPAPDHRSVPADTLLQEGALERVATGHADDPGTVPPAVAASAWTNHAATVLVPGVLAAWTLEAEGLDARPANVVLHLEDGLPRRLRLRDPAPLGSGPGPRDAGLETLMGDLLAPLLEGLEEATGLPPEVGWTTVGTLVAWMYDRMADHAPEAAPVEADRARLLEAEEAAWTDAPNPLAHPVDRVAVEAEDLPDEVLVRRTCCTKREIPGKQPCHTCPNIGPGRRRALLRQDGHGDA